MRDAGKETSGAKVDDEEASSADQKNGKQTHRTTRSVKNEETPSELGSN
jgi:hypothetical protein